MTGGGEAAGEPAVQAALAALRAKAEPRIREGLPGYGIVTRDEVIGVSMAAVQKLGKEMGRDHALAQALWSSGVYEGRMLAAYVADPASLTTQQMDDWARGFDNWATCDTLCFSLFDRSPHAWSMVDRWVRDENEFVKRAALALLAALALHDKKADDAPFLERLQLVEEAARDGRNFVWKGASWALRAIGRRRSPGLQAAAEEVAQGLACRPERSARAVGKETLKALSGGASKPVGA